MDTSPSRLRHRSGFGAALLLGAFAQAPAQAALAQPAISALSPTSGAVGTVMIVKGSGFKATSTASIGGVPARFSYCNSTRLLVTVPAGASSGVVTVGNGSTSASSGSAFSVTSSGTPKYPPPYILSFTPTSAAPGATVTVTGCGYTAPAGSYQISVGGAAAVSATVIDDNTLQFVLPDAALSGGLTISNPLGKTMTSTALFSVLKKAVPPVPVDARITVDQFGYRPASSKVAVIRSPVSGYDAGQSFVPGSSYRVIRSSDGVSVYQGTPAAWNGGAVAADAGDAGWWFDFSSVTAPGRYYVLDVAKNVRSPEFSIDAGVYRNALRAATRVYFYQRSGMAKQAPYAEACWTDNAAFLGPNQDSQARDITDPTNAAKVRDLRGGWFDAGDINKYVTYAVTPVHQLLSAYTETPSAFTDDFNIPESGNGIPDVVDEVKWEVDWLKRMQNADGSALLKVGQNTSEQSTPPSSDTHPHYYVPACTSATAAVAGMFAHASYVYAKFPALQTEAADLKARAIKAYDNWLAAPVKQTNCDDGTVKAGDADLPAADQDNLITLASVYLYAITGDARYTTRLRDNYTKLRPYNDMGWSRYLPEQGEALLFYTTLSNADPALKSSFLAGKLNDANPSWNRVYASQPTADLYRAYLDGPQYHWGSNQVRGNYGNSNRDVATYNIGVASSAPFLARAEDTLHYFHGVNPFGIVYLSNVNRLGTTKSVDSIYHTWFVDGSPIWDDVRTSSCGPAPGYVPAGPNSGAAASGVPSYLTPPTNQPPQKSYAVWNTGWPESSWTVNEPGIYYQSAYVKLVSGFVQ